MRNPLPCGRGSDALRLTSDPRRQSRDRKGAGSAKPQLYHRVSERRYLATQQDGVNIRTLPGTSHSKAIVAIPTLNAGPPLAACLGALSKQTFEDFETIVVDNSCQGLARPHAGSAVRVIANSKNVGFGAAVNQAIESSAAPFVCALNDDARPRAQWLESLLAAAEGSAEVGMCASRILLSEDALDSAGLGIYPDGTTKQRGHGSSPADHCIAGEALLPSGCAALYRREMLDEVGTFDPEYFLYCEDADLGLRGRLAGWRCRYVPEAIVEHDYSVSSGRASAMKVFHVERNRLYTVVKTFPPALWPLVPLFTLRRYWAHLASGRAGKGLAGEFGRRPMSLVGIVLSAHWRAFLALPRLLRERRRVRRFAKLGTGDFWKLLKQHHISAREIAAQ